MLDSKIIGPLLVKFKDCEVSGVFSDVWKKSNIVPVHNKRNQQIAVNYTHTSFSTSYYWNHRNIKKQGIKTAETSIIKLDGFYWFR